MCTSIWFKDAKKHVSNVRELADHMEIEPCNLVWHDGSSPVEDEHKIDFKYCLCPIDIPATMKACGYVGDWDKEGDPMGFVAEKAA